MYTVQKGILPTITGITSFILPFWILGLDVDYVLRNINTRIPEMMGDTTKPLWLLIVMFFFFTLFFPVLFSMILASIFPTIEVRKDGINFAFLGFFGAKVKWEEIDSLVYYPNNYILLRIDKRGFPLLNGLYFNQLQAGPVKSQLPILIFSPGLQNRDEIVSEIIEKASPRIVRKN